MSLNDIDSDSLELNLRQFYSDTDDDDWVDISLSESEEQERFQDHRLIASGGMKDIFKVFDSKTKRHIALAKLRVDVAEEFVEYFMKEAYLTASLEHPNIISVYDVGRDSDDQPFFTMELKVGDSLHQILKKRSEKDEFYLKHFPLRNLLEIFLKVCDAVSYAHSEGILHQDIKPDNIQVGKFGEVQLCDWGLGSDVKALRSGDKVEGTPGYMAPEQIQPKKAKSFQSDIYSLGALLYSILTDKAPGKGGIKTVIHDTISGKISFPRERFPKKEIPASLDAVVRKAMSVESIERYESVDDLKEEVLKYITGHSTEAEDAGVVKEVKLFYKRNKSLCNITIFALMFISIGTAIFLLKLSESKKETETTLEKLTLTHKALQESQKSERAQVEKQLQLSEELFRKSYEEALLKTKRAPFYERPVDSMKEALDLLQKYYEAKKNNAILRLIVELHFISQNFNKVVDIDHPERKSLTNIARRYSVKQLNEDGAINDIDFQQLLKDMNRQIRPDIRQKLMERMIVYNLKLNKRAYARPEIIAQLIKCWNPDWDSSKLSYKKDGFFLKLRGHDLRILAGNISESSRDSFLRFIKINHLNISHTGIESFRQLAGLSAKVIDIRNNKITTARIMNHVRNLNSVIIHEGQFSREELKRLPASVIVEVK